MSGSAYLTSLFFKVLIPPTEYIVVFKKGVTKDQIKKYKEEISQKGGNVEKELDNINGFSATIPEGFLSEFHSSANDVIDYIEPDGVVTTQD